MEKWLNDGYHILMIDGRHQSRSAEKLKHEDGVCWAAEPLHMQHAFRNNRNAISPAQDIKLSKIVNIYTAIVQRKATITYTSQSPVTFVRCTQKYTGNYLFA